MPRIHLSGSLSSNDQTQVEGVLELGMSLSGVLSDGLDLVGDLTTAIEMAGALPVPVTLSGNLNSSDPAGALPIAVTLAGALSTGIALAGALSVPLTLRGRLRPQQSGSWQVVGSPGDVWPAALSPTRNSATLTPSLTSATARMVEA